MSGCNGDCVAQKADNLYSLTLEKDVHVYGSLIVSLVTLR